MKKVIVGCTMGLVLVLCMGYAKAGFAMEFAKVENSDCRDDTNYHNRACEGWSELTELQYPSEWDNARRNRDRKLARWYGVGNKATGERMIRMSLGGGQFDFDKSNLRADTIPILDKNVAKLKVIKYSRINVVGYTDSKGTKEYNQVLSEERAQTVKDYLVNQGIASDRIMVEGRGESGAMIPNVTPSGKDYPAGRARNRRVIELQIWAL